MSEKPKHTPQWLAAGLRALAARQQYPFGELATELREAADLIDRSVPQPAYCMSCGKYADKCESC